MTAPVGGLLVAFVVTAMTALPLRAIAVRVGIMDNPGQHKSHKTPTPYLGGVAITLGLLAGIAVGGTHFWRLAVLLLLVTALGLADDLWTARPLPKLIIEFVLAAAAIGLGFVWSPTDSPILNASVTAVWIVGLTNAFNLLDNMDGLSATVAAASLAGLAILSPAIAPVALAVAGGAVGFLLLNRPPARMYMGDAGSLTLGFAAAVCSIVAAGHGRGVHSLVLMVLPVAVAVLDTSLVVVSRLVTGRPVQLGGRDHTSHRLLLLGWGRYQILGMALVASAAGSAAALLASRYPQADAWLGLPIVAAYAGAWLRLLRVDPYSARVSPSLEVRRAQ